MSNPSYRIEFTIQRADEWGAEFVDIGFGSSGDAADVDSAVYGVTSLVQNRIWETEPGMPDPSEVDKERAGE